MNFTIRIVTLSIVLLSMLNSFANTYGPSVPEVSKFEPFDATNLVDLYTGDFIYTLPLLEVPGPGGGYPIVLSYKAGIPTNDVASWVGLGWNLTPGYINRSVAGLPDDMKNAKVLTVSKDMFAQHFGVGIYDYISVGGQYDNANGFSGYVGVNKPMAGNSFVGFALSARVDTRGNAAFDAGVQFGDYSEGKNNTYFKKSLGVSIGSAGSFTATSSETVSGMGFSISSANGNASLYFSGQAWIFNFGFGAQSGTYDTYSYGYLYSDQMIKDADNNFTWTNKWKALTELILNNCTGYKMVGSILRDYSHRSIEDQLINEITEQDGSFDPLTQNLYQTEAIVENLKAPSSFWIDLLTNQDKYRYPNIYLARDDFMVNAQGLNGTMSAFRNNENVTPRNDIFNRTSSGDYKKPVPEFDQFYLNARPADYNPLSDGNTKHEFRFVGDPGGNFKTGAEHLSSRKVSYETESDGRIKSFAVTKEDGIVYKYNKSAKNNLEVSVSINEKVPNAMDLANVQFANDFVTCLTPIIKGGFQGANVNYAMKINDNSYAYAWYLTSVEGPDYVDINNNGKPDKEDFGYWVKFNYSSTPDVSN